MLGKEQPCNNIRNLQGNGGFGNGDGDGDGDGEKSINTGAWSFLRWQRDNG